jgi:hypothetical protein
MLIYVNNIEEMFNICQFSVNFMINYVNNRREKLKQIFFNLC